MNEVKKERITQLAITGVSLNKSKFLPVALVLLCAVVAAAVPSAAFAGAQPHMLDGLYADVALLPAVQVGNSLTAKLDAAQAAIDRGQTRTAINQLNAFGHELNGRFIGNPNLIGNPDLFVAINGDLTRVLAALSAPPPR
jgi:hypothetical protein